MRTFIFLTFCFIHAGVTQPIGEAEAATDPKTIDYCRSVFGEGFSNLKLCVDNEKRARANLSRMNVDQKTIDYCKSVFGEGYSNLKLCVDNELKAKKDLGL